jgi:arsenate reductase
MSERIRMLFLCTGNSCRSQMAEGWARALAPERLEAASAGTAPCGVNPLAVKVMAEAGADISHQQSKHVDDVKDAGFDVVVTLCDPAREACPLFPGNVPVVHHPFPDPAAATGSEDDVLAVFRRVRDEIKTFVQSLPDKLPV